MERTPASQVFSVRLPGAEAARLWMLAQALDLKPAQVIRTALARMAAAELPALVDVSGWRIGAWHWTPNTVLAAGPENPTVTVSDLPPSLVAFQHPGRP